MAVTVTDCGLNWNHLVTVSRSITTNHHIQAHSLLRTHLWLQCIPQHLLSLRIISITAVSVLHHSGFQVQCTIWELSSSSAVQACFQPALLSCAGLTVSDHGGDESHHADSQAHLFHWPPWLAGRYGCCQSWNTAVAPALAPLQPYPTLPTLVLLVVLYCTNMGLYLYSNTVLVWVRSLL